MVRTQEQRGYSTSLSLAPATGLPTGKAAGLLSLQEPKAHFCGHPSLKTSCCTQCRSPLRACKDTDALKAIAFPLHFHNTGSHTNCGSSAQALTRTGRLEVLTLYRWPKNTPPFGQMQIKLTARSYSNMLRNMCMLASCLVHGSSTFKLSKKNHSE